MTRDFIKKTSNDRGSSTSVALKDRKRLRARAKQIKEGFQEEVELGLGLEGRSEYPWMEKRRLGGSFRLKKRHGAEEVGKGYPDTWRTSKKKDGVEQLGSLFKSITVSLAP